ncbi:hypothetical protein ACM92Y_001059 [Cronobacter malonaticus]
MSNTYQIRTVTVTVPPIGMVGTDAAGNVVKKGDKCLIDICAVKPDWREKKIFEGFIVGHIACEGYSEHHFNRTQKVMIPEGHKLVALILDKRGTPKSWDSLPVHIADSCIGSPVDELDGIADLPLYKITSDYAIQQKIADALDNALARHYEQFGKAEPEKTSVFILADRWVAIEGSYSPDEIRDAVEYIKRSRLAKEMEKSMKENSPFSVVKDGQVFFNEAFINDASKITINISAEMEKAISDAVSEQLKKNLQPGGTIWNTLRRGF